MAKSSHVLSWLRLPGLTKTGKRIFFQPRIELMESGDASSVPWGRYFN